MGLVELGVVGFDLREIVQLESIVLEAVIDFDLEYEVLRMEVGEILLFKMEIVGELKSVFVVIFTEENLFRVVI